MKKRVLASLFVIGAVVAVPDIASAHVVVTPDTATVAEELVFTVSVPNEKQVPVTNIKLLIPAGVTDVTPTAKDGWTVTTTTNGDDSDPAIAAIAWAGAIPVGQRQDFSFSAQVPGKATALDWKAYQTYADGTVVHWDQTPGGGDDATGDAGPYSVTHVTDDLVRAANTTSGSNASVFGSYVISAAALIVAIAALVRREK